MKTVKGIITECFKRARMELVATERTKYLFQLLCDELDSHFLEVRKNKRSTLPAKQIKK
jgi:hypothetical protein